jgi:predicted hotdog family 3-hydroxylacyl-ACP dehydratase
MLLLDSVEAYNMDDLSIETEVRISESSEFFRKEEGYVPLWVSFEYMAQSIAVFSGIKYRSEGEDPKIGFIMGVRDFKGEAEGFTAGDSVSVRVKQSFRDGDVAVFEGEASVDGKVYSSAIINVIENNKELVDKWVTEL